MCSFVPKCETWCCDTLLGIETSCCGVLVLVKPVPELPRLSPGTKLPGIVGLVSSCCCNELDLATSGSDEEKPAGIPAGAAAALCLLHLDNTLGFSFKDLAHSRLESSSQLQFRVFQLVCLQFRVHTSQNP